MIVLTYQKCKSGIHQNMVDFGVFDVHTIEVVLLPCYVDEYLSHVLDSVDCFGNHHKSIFEMVECYGSREVDVEEVFGELSNDINLKEIKSMILIQ